MTAVLAAGCDKPVESGFLSPYGSFEKCSLLSGNLEYVNPHADWKQYKKVHIREVVVYYANISHEVDPRDAAMLTAYFEQQLAKAFSEDYQIVPEGGPGVLEVRAAITNLRPTNVGENAAAQTAGILLPGFWSVGMTGYKKVTGDQLGMGEAQVEAEFRDCETGERLYGYLARNIGSALDVKGQTTAWGVVETALGKWARVLHQELVYRQDPSTINKLKQEMK